MKKQIQISQACMEFLFSIVESTPAKDRKSVKMMNVLFQSLKEPMNESTTFRNETRKKFMKKTLNDRGEEVEEVPKEDMERFNQELVDGMNKKVTLEFDRETFTYLRSDLLANVFTTNPNLKEGLSGSLHMRLFDELMTAIESPKEVQ